MRVNNSEYTIPDFRRHLLISLLNVKYSLRNKWFDHVKRLFQHVMYSFQNILFIKLIIIN